MIYSLIIWICYLLLCLRRVGQIFGFSWKLVRKFSLLDLWIYQYQEFIYLWSIIPRISSIIIHNKLHYIFYLQRWQQQPPRSTFKTNFLQNTIALEHVQNFDSAQIEFQTFYLIASSFIFVQPPHPPINIYIEFSNKAQTERRERKIKTLENLSQ